ncbi:MAG: bifunctional nuclease family protein, partial [Candidatus Brocadiae bacterium]|nr:bifunctional nuclease family protein [Candidatus Brocadiia bacterium]
IVLKEKDGERKMPILIGVSEVFAIHRIINDEPPPRPLTHELFGQVLDVLGVSVQRVVINELSQGTYFGRLILSRNGQTFDVDSRPSDAIVLATQKGAPIFVEETVLDEAAKQN